MIQPAVKRESPLYAKIKAENHEFIKALAAKYNLEVAPFLDQLFDEIREGRLSLDDSNTKSIRRKR